MSEPWELIHMRYKKAVVFDKDKAIELCNLCHFWGEKMLKFEIGSPEGIDANVNFASSEYFLKKLSKGKV